MAIKVTFTKENKLLRVKALGKDDNLEDAQKYGLQVLEEAIKSNVDAVLCDETELIYNLKTIDTFELASFLSENVPKVGKAAIVCNPDQISDASFWENVAVNRGLQVRVFKSLIEAEAWLL